jgi:hypothetical protein
MAASASDMYQLSLDPVFQGRVQAEVLLTCINIAAEGWAVAFHDRRAAFAQQILTTTSTPNPYFTLFSNSVSTDPSVISDATQAGTVVLTSGNRATQAALVTDTHINNAVSGQFNAYIRQPQ